MIIQPYEETKRFNSISLVVSNRRIRYEVEKKICQSMSLTSISSIGLAYSEERRFISYAIISGLLGLFIYLDEIRLSDNFLYLCVIATIYFIIRYLLSRKNKLAIYGSGKDHILINIDRRSYSSAKEVLDYIEDLKLKLE